MKILYTDINGLCRIAPINTAIYNAIAYNTEIGLADSGIVLGWGEFDGPCRPHYQIAGTAWTFILPANVNLEEFITRINAN